MAVYNRELRAAFESTLALIPGLPKIQWENTPLEPEADEAYIQVEFKVRGRPPITRGINHKLRYRGQLVLEVHVPLGSGPAPAEEITDALLEAFPPTGDIELLDLDGYTLGLYATVETSHQGIGFRFSNHYVLPVYIDWYAYLPQ